MPGGLKKELGWKRQMGMGAEQRKNKSVRNKSGLPLARCSWVFASVPRFGALDQILWVADSHST